MSLKNSCYVFCLPTVPEQMHSLTEYGSFLLEGNYCVYNSVLVECFEHLYKEMILSLKVR